MMLRCCQVLNGEECTSERGYSDFSVVHWLQDRLTCPGHLGHTVARGVSGKAGKNGGNDVQKHLGRTGFFQQNEPNDGRSSGMSKSDGSSSKWN